MMELRILLQVGICAKGARGVGFGMALSFQLLCDVFCDDKSPFLHQEPIMAGPAGLSEGSVGIKAQ